MRSKFWKMLSGVRTLVREDGQDLVEYAMVVALIALSAVAGERSLANQVSTAFSRIGTTLSSYTS